MKRPNSNLGHHLHLPSEGKNWTSKIGTELTNHQKRRFRDEPWGQTKIRHEMNWVSPDKVPRNWKRSTLKSSESMGAYPIFRQNPMKISTKGPDTPHPNRLGWRPCWACHSHRWVHCCSAAHARRSSSYAARKPPIWGLSKTEGIKEICQFKTKMMNRQICWCLWNKPIATPEKLRWNPKNCHVQSEIIFQTA